MKITRRDVRFRAVRASGPGGSRRNRRSTKVQVWVSLGKLPLSVPERRRLRTRLRGFLTRGGEVLVESEETRSQAENVKRAVGKLNALLRSALAVPRRRIPTEPPRWAEDWRIQGKKLRSEKKRARRMSH